MEKTIIAEGKTTNEAIENGLKQLQVSKEDVEIKVLENKEKKSFFSILAPRVVKVELTVKEKQKEVKKVEREYNHNKEEIEEAKERVKKFLKEFLNQVGDLQYTIRIENDIISIRILGKDAGTLIGYRGETLNAMQSIVSAIANQKSSKKICVSLDIEGYKAKREKTLQELAIKISKTVQKTGKSVTLEPMSPYERKIIHSALQSNTKVTTHSIGENESRRVVVSLKK